MKIKLGKLIYSINPALQKIMNTKLSIQNSFKFIQLLKLLENDLESFKLVREKIIKENDPVKEGENLVIPQFLDIGTKEKPQKIENPKFVIARKQFNELENQEIEIKFDEKINISKEVIEIEPLTLLALEDFIQLST